MLQVNHRTRGAVTHVLRCVLFICKRLESDLPESLQMPVRTHERSESSLPVLDTGDSRFLSPFQNWLGHCPTRQPFFWLLMKDTSATYVDGEVLQRHLDMFLYFTFRGLQTGMHSMVGCCVCVYRPSTREGGLSDLQKTFTAVAPVRPLVCNEAIRMSERERRMYLAPCPYCFSGKTGIASGSWYPPCRPQLTC